MRDPLELVAPTRVHHRAFWPVLGLISIAAFGIRVANTLLTTQRFGVTDSAYYHLQANLLATGGGFRDPFLWLFFKRVVPTAFHPPLFSTVLAVPSLLGLGTELEHRIAACVIGTVAVILISLLARRLGGSRVGLIAAGLAAIYPNLWQIDGLLFSEGLAAALVVLALILAYRLLDQPTYSRAIALGAVIGLGALTRPETILLTVLLAVPITLRASGVPSRRLGHLAASFVAAILVMTPWLVRNLTTFEKPVLFSTNGDAVLGVANCPATYYDSNVVGYWAPCASLTRRQSASAATARLEESTNAAQLRSAGLDYLWSHRARFAKVVVWARLARVWDVFPNPMNNIRVTQGEGRNQKVLIAGLAMYWAVAFLAVCGARLLYRRRGPPLWPLLTPFVVVCVVAVYAYGAIRFRAVAEPSLLVLAAIAVDAIVSAVFPSPESLPGRPFSTKMNGTRRSLRSGAGSGSASF